MQWQSNLLGLGYSPAVCGVLGLIWVVWILDLFIVVLSHGIQSSHCFFEKVFAFLPRVVVFCFEECDHVVADITLGRVRVSLVILN